MHRANLIQTACACIGAALAPAAAVSAADTPAAPAAAPVAAAPLPSSDFGPWGLDLTARDPSVRPGADFYMFANGHWIATNVIPPDRASWNGFTSLVVVSVARLEIYANRHLRKTR